MQLSCSIPFIKENLPENQEILKQYREITLNLLKDHSVPRSFHTETATYYDKDNRKKRLQRKVFYADPIKEDLYKTLCPEISHARIRLENPFTVTVEFNFIKYLDAYLTKAGYYDTDTRPNSTIAGSNFIPSYRFTQLENKTDVIREMIYSVPETVTQFSQYIIQKIIPDFQYTYKTVTIKQIEFNRDYQTPLNRAAEYQHKIQEYLVTYQGIDYLRSLGSYVTNQYSRQQEKEEETLHSCGDLTCPTLKYFLKDGFIIKIYRKDYDLVRFEITVIGHHIRTKCRYTGPDGEIHTTQSYQRCIDTLFTLANQFFNQAHFNDIIQIVGKQIYNDKYAFLSDILDFYDTYEPHYSIINDSIMHRTPIREHTTVDFIRRHPYLSTAFESQLDKNGNKILIFKPSFNNTQTPQQIEVTHVP